MTVESQLLLALRHVATSVAGAVFLTAVLYVRKRGIIVGCRLLRRKFAQHRRPS